MLDTLTFGLYDLAAFSPAGNSTADESPICAHHFGVRSFAMQEPGWVGPDRLNANGRGDPMNLREFPGRVFRVFLLHRTASLLLLVAVAASCSFAFATVRGKTLSLIQAVGSRAGAVVTTRRTPELAVTTEGSFAYEGFAQMFSGTMPVSPNTWHLVSTITNNGSSAVEIVPIYLYSEASPSGTDAFLNASTICPKSYVQDFSPNAQNGLTIAPEDLSGSLETGVALPMEQLDMFPDSPGSLAAMVGSRSFDAAITVDKTPAGWARAKIGPHSVIGTTWEFASVWASPMKVRTNPAFEIVFVGPIVRPADGTHGKSYLVVAKLSAVDEAGKNTIKQASFQLMAITPTLSQDLAKAFPANHGALIDFGDAVAKIVAGP